MKKLDMHSPDLVAKNIDALAALFPNCLTEAADENGRPVRRIDFDLLRQELEGNLVEGPTERFRLDWPGKRQTLLTANAPIAKTLRPDRESSVNFDSTRNIYIEGDNLDALKLLQENYLGKVKMIYIDPPYNIDGDYIYNDDCAEERDEYLLHSNQKDEYGNRLTTNTEANGRFHSDWLSMMYSRLKLARNLLKDDGVIFISINNIEMANLRKICDETFGPKNFIECITWNKRIPKNDKGIGNIHDFILIYSKSTSCQHEFLMPKDGLDEIYDLVSKLKRNNTSILQAEAEIKKLYKKNDYDRGITLYNSLSEDYRLWGKINMSWPNANSFGPRYEVTHPMSGLPVAIPDRGWRWKRETFYEAAKYYQEKYQDVEVLPDGSVRCGRIWFDKDEKTQPSSITYLDEVEDFLLRSILSMKSDGGIEVEDILGGKNIFSYPKPISLIKALLASLIAGCSNSEIVLDFFSGSSTTAHALLQLNAESGTAHSFIMIQLPEQLDPDDKKQKDGAEFCDSIGRPRNIAEIGKERIRKVGQKIIEAPCHESWNRDIGFRAFKIDSSNMADVYYTPDNTAQDKLAELVDNIKPGRTDEDLLFQVMLDWGLDLALPLEQKSIAGSTVFSVDGNALAACFDDRVSEELITELAAHKPPFLRVLFRDSSFRSDSDKINVEQIFKQLSPSTEVKVI